MLYYIALFGITIATGATWAELLQRLGDAGWVTMPDAGRGGQAFWEVYELYDLLPWRAERIAWGVLARQLPMTLALFSVVLFGSCLDITAIQASLPYEVCLAPLFSYHRIHMHAWCACLHAWTPPAREPLVPVWHCHRF